MPGITGIGRLPDGSYQVLNIRRQTPDGETVVAPLTRGLASLPVVDVRPSITGTVAPGQTVTAAGGTYSAATLTRVRFSWRQARSNGTTFASGTGATFAIAANSPTGTLVLTEELTDPFGKPYSFTSVEAAITATASAPDWTVNPALSGTGVVGSPITLSAGTVTGTPTPTVSNEWFFNGVQRTSLIAASYTPVAGEIGQTISAQRRAVNSAGTAVSPRTSGILIRSATTDVFNVSTQAQLTDAIAAANAGDLILLAPGTYSNINVGDRQNAGGVVTVRSAVKSDPAIITGSISGGIAAGWVFDNFIIGPASAAVGARTGNGVTFAGTYDRRTVNGQEVNTITVPARITLRNLLVRNRQFGITFPEGSDDLTIEACEVVGFQHDGIRLYNRHRNAIVRNTHVHGCIPDPTRGDHRDFFQMAINRRGTGGGSCTVEDCYFDASNVEATQVLHQGLIILNGLINGTGSNSATLPDHGTGSWPADAQARITVRRNFMTLRWVHGVLIGGALNVDISGNTMRRAPANSAPYRPDSDNGTQPRVSCSGQSRGTVTNNIVANAQFWSSNGATVGMWETFQQTASATAFPTGWVMPSYGRYVLD